MVPPPRLSMKLQGLFPCTTPIIQKYYGIVIKNKILKIKNYYFNKISKNTSLQNHDIVVKNNLFFFFS
jgi:hypothetical protein